MAVFPDARGGRGTCHRHRGLLWRSGGAGEGSRAGRACLLPEGCPRGLWVSLAGTWGACGSLCSQGPGSWCTCLGSQVLAPGGKRTVLAGPAQRGLPPQAVWVNGSPSHRAVSRQAGPGASPRL